MIKKIEEYWSCPAGIYEFDEDIADYIENIKRDDVKKRVIIFPSARDWGENKKKLDQWKFKGIAVVIGDLIELSSILTLSDLSKYERIIACRVKNKGHKAHKLLFVLNYSKEQRPYREIREKYTFCPICGKSSKDYGGKKHHYPSDGTWIRDVWNKFTLREPLINDTLFLEAIYNLYCLDPSQQLVVLKRKSRKSGKEKKSHEATSIEDTRAKSKIDPSHTFFGHNQWLIKGDSLDILPWLRDKNELFDLVFVDPPYNLGKKYDIYNDNQSIQDYTNWCLQWERVTYPLIKDDGYFVILNTPLNILLQLPSLLEHYEFIGDIVWDDLAVPVTGKMQPTYYSIIFLGKKNSIIERSSYKIKEPLYCKRNSCRDDVHSFRDGLSIWSDIHRTRQKSRRWGHPCNLPEELIERIIEVTQKSLNRKELNILDFFNGVGTTTMASLRKNCRSTGVELSDEYFETSKFRLENTLYHNPNNKVKRNNKKKTKRLLQKTVAMALEGAERINKDYNTSEQIEWLIKKGVIKESDLETFVRPGEILKAVGKGGAPGEKRYQTQLPL